MFHYEYPIFEHKKLLRIEMLNQLRDYPQRLVSLGLHTYSNGILCGCEVGWKEGELQIKPGMIFYHGRLYSLLEEETLPLMPSNQLLYLKVRFLAESQETGYVLGTGCLELNPMPPERSSEMELGRFWLQEGARLRINYENFEDYATSYDTLNRIEVPYAAREESTLWPQLLCCFAEEMLEIRTGDLYDVNVCMAIIANEGRVPRQLLAAYLKLKGIPKESGSSKAIYEALLQCLKQAKSGDLPKQKRNETNRGIMLL